MIFRYLFYILALHSILQADTIEIGSTKNIYNNFEIPYVSNDTKAFTIEEVSQKEFTSKTSNNFSLGYKKGSVWFKITVQNSSDKEEFILSINEHFYEKANLFHYDTKWIEEKNGLFTPLQSREIKNKNLSFPLHLKQGKTETYYLQIQGRYAYFGNIVLYEKETFYLETQFDSNYLFIYALGILTIIVILNLFLFIKLKEKIYIIYVGYSFFNLVFILNISGLLTYVDLQYYIYDLHLSAAFMIAFLILFSREYLQTDRYLKRVSKVLLYLAVIFFFVGILVVYSYQPWNKVINNLSGLSTLFLIITSLIIYIKGNRNIIFYIGAMLIYLYLVALFTLMVAGVLEYSFITRYGFIIATTFEASIFSLLIANRYHQLKNEKIASQNQLLELQRDNHSYLEKEIQERTNDLNESNIQLQSLLSERELLLKEVFHRVKNNFHMIIGILWIQGNKYKDNAPFHELINKIKSMAKINDYLYTSDNITQIEIDDYLGDIIKFSSVDANKIKLTVSIEKLTVSFNDAMSLGIILNELLTNSIKHNQHLDEILITITLKKDMDRCILLLHDNATKFKEDAGKSGIGMILIQEFSSKLKDASYKFSFEKGARFHLNFEPISDSC